MAHKLAVYIDDCNNDCRVLTIRDISSYDSNITVTNPVLKLTIPGQDCNVFPVWMFSHTNYFTSASLGLTSGVCSESLIDLPDGLYDYTYSVCPNEEVFVRGSFLRTCQTECLIYTLLGNTIKNRLCKNNNTCGCSENEQLLKDLLLILKSGKSDALEGRLLEACSKYSYVSERLNDL